jgi:hypothetical protein
LLGRELGVSTASIIEVWHKWDLQPWRRETFKFSTDPQLEAKLTDIVGLYLHPPENAVVVCIDEKSQIQALDRTQPILPLRPGLPERATHDYIRHGITTLFAALDVATGQIVDACYPRHRHQEFLRFLKKVAAAWPGQQLHVVCDNYATHNHPEVRAWLAKTPRVTLHFTPTSCSWLNMVEMFSIITRQAIRRGDVASVDDLRPQSAGSSTLGTTAASRRTRSCRCRTRPGWSGRGRDGRARPRGSRSGRGTAAGRPRRRRSAASHART